MAGPTRLELATSCVTGRRSNQLNYGPEQTDCSMCGEFHKGSPSVPAKSCYTPEAFRQTTFDRLYRAAVGPSQCRPRHRRLPAKARPLA